MRRVRPLGESPPNVLQLLPVGGTRCDEFGRWATPPPNVSQLLPVGGTKCDEFGRQRRMRQTLRAISPMVSPTVAPASTSDGWWIFT